MLYVLENSWRIEEDTISFHHLESILRLRDEKTLREAWKRDDAIEHFKKKGEIYKN